LAALLLGTVPLFGQTDEPAQPVSAPEDSILAYVPADADLAVHLRMDKLVESNLWKLFPKYGFQPAEKFREKFHLAIDLEEDVTTAVLVLKITFAEDGTPEDVLFGAAFAVERDVQPQSLIEKGRESRPTEVPGAPVPMYPVAPDIAFAVPDSRTLVMASPQYMPAMLAAPNLSPVPPIRKPLTAPGEMALAGCVPDQLKAAIRREYDFYQTHTQHQTAIEQWLELALLYTFVQIAEDTEQVTGSLDLSREPDAAWATVSLASDRTAPLLAAGLAALAGPLAMNLPQLFGEASLDEPPETPLYLTEAAGNEVRMAMSRANVLRLIEQTLKNAKRESDRARSAGNLRILGIALRQYAADHRAYPPNWLVLFPDYLADRIVLKNPALDQHAPDGDYVLVPLTPEAVKKEPWAKVLAYEVYPETQPPAAGANVLFADGHVEYVSADEFHQVLRQTLERLGR